jgi:hypothetical protein
MSIESIISSVSSCPPMKQTLQKALRAARRAQRRDVPGDGQQKRTEML